MVECGRLTGYDVTVGVTIYVGEGDCTPVHP